MNFDVISPSATGELLRLIDEYQDRNFRFCAGGTDLLIELKHKPDDDLTVINLARLGDPIFKSIAPNEGGLRIGALATANEIVANEFISERFPVLRVAAHSLASCQIREVATVGGNLCTASPAGDISCALMALEASCELLSSDNQIRVVPISQFFSGIRKTCLKSSEILRGVVIKSNRAKALIHSNFIKIGIRRSMECAVVSLAFHIQSDLTGIIAEAGVAIGSAAPMIKRAVEAGNYLCGMRLKDIGSAEAEEFAGKVVAYASPISDLRGSAWYREAVLYNISKGIFDNR